MNKFNELKFLALIGKINSSLHCPRIEIVKCGERDFQLFIPILKTARVIVCRFSVCQNIGDNEKPISCFENSKDRLPVAIKYWKVFFLPFHLLDFALTKDEVWILGEECYSNIKPYLMEHLTFDSLHEDSLMDVDDEEFAFQSFEHKINLPSVLKHKITSEKFYLKCDAFQKGIIMGSNDSKKLQLNLVRSNYQSLLNAELSDTTLLLDMEQLPSRKDDPESPSSIVPVFKLCPVEHTESKSNVLKTLLGSSFENCVGFVSQPNHKICYFLCSWPVDINILVKRIKLKELYDMKQPILGVHIVHNIGGIKGTNVLVVGSLGKIVCLTERSISAKSQEILVGNVSLHATTFELSSSVKQHVILKDDVLYLSLEGKLYCSKFSAEEGRLVISKRCTLLQQVMKFVPLNERLLLILMNSGHLHLYEYSERKCETTLSTLMNQAMLISSHLQTLNSTKSHQANFFEAVSIFASMKFKGIKDMKILFTYSIRNMKNPRRIFISVHIKGLESYKLNSDFWVLWASISSCYEKKCPIISKAMPLDSGNPSICMEVEEKIFRSWDSLPLPFVLELGFILTLPEKLKQMDCFKMIKKELPLCFKAKEIILDELSFMETEPVLSMKRLKTSPINKLMKDVLQLSKKRPIYQLLRPGGPLIFTPFLDNFQLCILQPTAEIVSNMDTLGDDLPVRWLQGVMRKVFENGTSVFDIESGNKMASITVSIINSHVIFNIHSDEFDFLAGLKIAVARQLVMLQDLTSRMNSSVFMVSDELRKNCEELSKELLSLSEQDVEQEEIIEIITQKYINLRTISSKLIYC